MSTQRFMSRICNSPGRFTFAMLLGVLLALPCLLPAAVFARASGQTGAISLSSPPNASTSVLTKVGVSVVRLVATYGTAGDQMQCTGLGVLISSSLASATSTNYENAVLSDGNVIRDRMTTCGKPGDLRPLSEVQVWTSTGYTGGNAILLDQLTACSTSNSVVSCKDALPSLLPDTVTVMPPTSYALLSFQSKSGEPYIGLSSSTNPTGTSLNIGLTNPSEAVYPSREVDADVTTYLTPNVVPTPPGIPNGGSAVSTNFIEAGTPEIDGQDQLVGMWVNDGNGSYISPRFTQLQTALQTNPLSTALTPVASPLACTSGATVAVCWNSGIDAFNASNYAVADEYLSKVSVLNPQFTAAHKYALLAQQHLPVGRDNRDGASSSSSSVLSSLLKQWQLIVTLVALVVVLLLLLVVVLTARARKRRRELAKFGAEFAEGRRIATEQAAQRQRAPQPQVALASCPNCHNPVPVTDVMCPTCRFPLSPSASGLNVRLAGSAPLVSSPLPPLSVPAVSEQPTVQFLPVSPIPPTAEFSEPISKQSKFQTPEEFTQEVQQLRGRNLSLAVGTLSDPGIKRKHKPNEDSMFAFQWDRTHNSQHQQFGLFVVADGMGGHANGQDASRLAIQTMIDFMLPRVISGEQVSDEVFLKLMGDGVQASNQAVHNRNLESHADMGTTMTAALVVGATAYVANVGDSRTYLYREGQGLSKVTHDHSVVASLVDAGIIKPDDVYTHPKRNQIYRSLGEKPVVEVDTFPVTLLPGDKILLCSDGLWDMVRDPLIQSVLGKTIGDPNEIGQKLIKAALDGGGEDNVSVIIVQFAEMNEHTGMTGVQLLAKPETVTVPNLPAL